MRAREIMTHRVVTIGPDATVGEAARMMLERNVSCLPVVDERGRLVGILTHTDFGLHPRYLPLAGSLYTLMGRWASPEQLEEVAQGLRGVPVREVMEREVVTVDEEAPVARVADLMLRHRVHRLPVVRGQELVGIISRHDLLKLITHEEAKAGDAPPGPAQNDG